jgi:thymidylate kinase
MLITFSGLDGAGKSTLIAHLKTVLEARDRQVAVLHMNDDVGLYAYARALRDCLLGLVRVRRPVPVPAGGGSNVPPEAAGAAGRRLRGALRGVRNGILWNKPIRRFIYLLDLVLFLFYRLYVEKIRKRVFIMDRYFYDTLVDVSTGKKSLWVRLLSLITPKPSLAIFLDITPEESYARKGEYTVEYLRMRWVGYHGVFAWVRDALVLPNDDLAATLGAVERAVLERMAK